MAIRAYYNATYSTFRDETPEYILGVLTREHHHALEEDQRRAWLEQIAILKPALADCPDARVFLEMYIPRMGKRVDVVVLAGNVVFVIEFKVGGDEYWQNALVQVEDYALDLKNFHEGSHTVRIVPVLVATRAPSQAIPDLQFADDLVALPIKSNGANLGELIRKISTKYTAPVLNFDDWVSRGYRPTPTIVEAAQVLYATHSVSDISRSDAGAKNLQATSVCVQRVIDDARQRNLKAICFVTGVPGSGKTLAGLNIATRRSDEHQDEHAVFLSGNGPLVEVLREALARDRANRESIAKKSAEQKVRSFIQNIHHFRDEYLRNLDIPDEKVVVFDEAQRAWTREQAAKFMKTKRGLTEFEMSEPEFLISVMDRHQDWCTIVCLVGNGQEINTGEAGISEWIRALESRFPNWQVFISPRVSLPEYESKNALATFHSLQRVTSEVDLHLAVSMRSYRAEALSDFVGQLISNEPEAARETYRTIQADYPIFLTRDLDTARKWLRNRARGTERFGLVASSGAMRLRPEGIYIKAAIEPPNWFLNGSEDVRSCYYLEDVANEFLVQGLELDWVGVCWDGDFHRKNRDWGFQSFKGTKWQSINDESRRLYLRNAYRVILTRARQGMILFVPKGDSTDPTRSPEFYDGTYSYLYECGIPALD
jgi:Uncharacterized conserved protein (DUF2075)